MDTPWQAKKSLRQNRDCLELPPRKAGTKWIVNLQRPKSDTDNEDDDNQDGAWDELAQKTFNIYTRSLFQVWDEGTDNYNVRI